MNPRFSFDPSTAASTGRVPSDSPGLAADTDTSAKFSSHLAEPLAAVEPALTVDRVEPVSGDGLFVPEGYEPSYAYPLLVWLTAAPQTPAEFARRMRQVSERNYLGLSLPVDLDRDPADIAADVSAAVCRLRREVHVHSERVIVAGVGSAGTLALEVGLGSPGWFGGAVSLGGAVPQTQRPLAQFEDLHGFRVLLGQSSRANDWRSLRRFERLLWAAGVDVSLWQCSQPQAGSSATLLRQIDCWVMSAVERESAVWV
ncbi:MAG: hypothetical protein EHM42_08175 [Planctomycetaceae bacterium]|nr:MAG: hypothetical protein EHM42_08175 [Planctomycetaceae bacterium]